jgi:hypothetical protein
MSIAAFSAAQSTDILQIYGTAGTLIHRVASNNAFYFGVSGSFLSSSGRVLAISDVASTVAVTARGAASQSANLQEWQDSAGTVLSRIFSSGGFFGPNAFLGPNATSIFSVNLGIIPSSASNSGIIIRGAASQSANLQEWRNSAGSILARVDSQGFSYAPFVRTTNVYCQMGEANSGGRFQMTRATTAVNNPGANAATLYYRDGTNAGTLKLVVRAGTGGAETTIFDNIPTT